MATNFKHTEDGLNLYREYIPKWNNKIHITNSIGCPSVISIKNENILLLMRV
jgi:hypothetical protein